MSVVIRLVNPANLWVVFLLYATAMLVGIARLFVVVYYPRDVLAEAILDIIDAHSLIEDNYP